MQAYSKLVLLPLSRKLLVTYFPYSGVSFTQQQRCIIMDQQDVILLGKLGKLGKARDCSTNTVVIKWVNNFRHGICHGCTDIIRVKFFMTGVKCSHDHTLFILNSFPVALLCCFGNLFRYIRGLTEENTQLGIISPIGYFKSPIGDVFSNWGLVICSLTLRYHNHISPIPDWIFYPKLGIWDPQLEKIFPIGDIVC